MNPDLNQIERDILVGLSDFIPRNQNQITDLIHKDRKKSTDRVHVHRALKNLAPYLERSPNKLDELGKRWVFKKDIDIIRQIVKKYPSIVPDLQKSDIILSMLANNVKPNNFFSEFKGMLRLSPSFFENFLRNDDFLTKWIMMQGAIHSPAVIAQKDLVNEIYEHCVKEDYLKEIFNFEEIKLLNRIKS